MRFFKTLEQQAKQAGFEIIKEGKLFYVEKELSAGPNRTETFIHLTDLSLRGMLGPITYGSIFNDAVSGEDKSDFSKMEDTKNVYILFGKLREIRNLKEGYPVSAKYVRNYKVFSRKFK
jgi:hypothetical protein